MGVICKATNAPGMDGKNSLDQAMQMLKGLLDKLMQGKGGGGGGGQGQGSQQQSPSSLYPPCQTNPATGTITSVPCVDSTGAVITSAQGNFLGSFATGTGSSISDTLLNSLGEDATESISPVSSLLEQAVSDGSVTEEGVKGTSPNLSSEAATGVPTSGDTVAKLEPEERGDILTSGTGATVVAGAKNKEDNSEVSGFIGSNTSGFSQPTTLVGGLCATRPWASGFLSSIITPSFFDGLCVWRGYHVGELPETPAAVTPYMLRNPEAARLPAPTGAGAGSAIDVEPAVDVWASPASVPLGTRTRIFWASQGVQNCTVTGPSFSQSALSGGAATVPISGASIFTVVCVDGEGEEVARDSVTVNLAI